MHTVDKIQEQLLRGRVNPFAARTTHMVFKKKKKKKRYLVQFLSQTLFICLHIRLTVGRREDVSFSQSAVNVALTLRLLS